MTGPTVHTNNTAQIRAIAEQCVKCGLCLPDCPTYQLHRMEAESPRGRIALAQSTTELEAINPSARAHLDSCLACGACEAVCPSNVSYQKLITQTRARIASHHRESLLRRIARSALERPRLSYWLNPLAYLWRWKYMPHQRRKTENPRGIRIQTPPTSTFKTPLALAAGCTGHLIEQNALDASERLFRHCGFDVHRLPASCCGALALHSGDIQSAERLSAAFGKLLVDNNVADYTGIVTGCAARYTEIGEAPARYHDPMQLLWRHRDRLRFRSDTRTVALHTPCTQRTSPESARATEQLLGLVPGLRLLTLPHRGRCCGGAGTYFLQHIQTAKQLRRATLEEIDRCKAGVILSANIGCRIQIASGRAIAILHPLEFLDELLER